MLTLKYKRMTLTSTLQLLEQGGNKTRECVVLWLGKRNGNEILVEQVYLPEQKSGVDVFHIPPNSMQTLMKHLKEHRLMVAAQVHTHPEKAFHSKADDDWAFVRHEGAISIVLPNFAKTTTSLNYWKEAETYCLSKKNTWEHVTGISLYNYCREVK